jgi:hypothetical protein
MDNQVEPNKNNVNEESSPIISKPKGNKIWWIVGIVVLLLVFLPFLIIGGGLVFLNNKFNKNGEIKKAVENSQNITSGDEKKASDAISNIISNATGSEVNVGEAAKIPDGLPEEIKIYKNNRVNFATKTDNESTLAFFINLQVDKNEKSENILNFYKESLGANWNIESQADYSGTQVYNFKKVGDINEELILTFSKVGTENTNLNLNYIKTK